MLVQLGELSSAGQALEGAAIAPGNRATLNELTNVARAVPRDPLPNDLVTYQPERGFELVEKIFGQPEEAQQEGLQA